MGRNAKLRHASGFAAALLICAAMGGCAEVAKQQLSPGVLPPVVNPVTEVNKSLRHLPPPTQKVVVAVYNYSDQTGQFKPSETTQTLSKAVTQGATSVLVKALQDVGNGSWFTVVERERIDNLLKERGIIAQMRSVYLGEKQINPKALPPLLFAGIIFEGGIIGFDSNVQTGGVGARLLGIGGDVKYRLNTITIYLRAVSTKTGQVVATVTTHKSIASVGLQGGVFKFIALDRILEAEAGFTKNEPEQLAVQQAIEKAVYAMVIEGSRENVWAFADKNMQNRLISDFQEYEVAAGPKPYGKAAEGATATAALPAAPANSPAAEAVAGKAGDGAVPAATAAAPATAVPSVSAAGPKSSAGPAAAAKKQNRTGDEKKTGSGPPAKPEKTASLETAWQTSVTESSGGKRPPVKKNSFSHSLSSNQPDPAVVSPK